MLSGESFDFRCHSNLTRAIMPFGLNEFDVHDVLNVFQVTGLNVNGQYFMCALLHTDFKNLQANLDFYTSGSLVLQNLAISSSSLQRLMFSVRYQHAREAIYRNGAGGKARSLWSAAGLWG